MHRKVLATVAILLFIGSILISPSLGIEISVDKEPVSSLIDIRTLSIRERKILYDYAEGTITIEQVKEKTQRQYECNEIMAIGKITTCPPKQSLPLTIGPIDSAWPMHAYNARSIGRSPYRTENTTNLEKWRINTQNSFDGGVVLDSEGNVYFTDNFGFFYKTYSNGSIQWRVYLDNFDACAFGNSPAIDENGIIYLGGHERGLFAIDTNGTVLWRTGWGVQSSPVIGSDGVVYASFTVGSSWKGQMRAYHPNGTLIWTFDTDDVIQSSPALTADGCIIFGSHDKYMYCLYANNGSLKWKYKTGGWVHGSPTIADDGTIYIGSDDEYLYSMYPNGILKWKTRTGPMRSSPSLDKEDTLYFGTANEKIWAVYSNGTIKWTFTPKKDCGIWGSTAAISDDGIVYIGCEKRYYYPEGGWIIAMYLNGTEKWRKTIGNSWVDSSPVIAEDGTVFIASTSDYGGALHAFGPVESNSPPGIPTIDGPKRWYTNDNDRWWIFTSVDPDKNPVKYYIDWGDGTEEWVEERASGQLGVFYHEYENSGTYTIRVKAKDVLNEESDWNETEVVIGDPYWTILFGNIDDDWTDYYYPIEVCTADLVYCIHGKFPFIKIFHSGETIYKDRERFDIYVNGFIAGKFEIIN